MALRNDPIITVPEAALRAELERLIADRDRYRAALERIARWPACGVGQKVAQEALASNQESGSE